MNLTAVEITRLMVVGIAGLAMIVGMVLVFLNLRKNNHGFGPNSLKALGLVCFLPTLLIVGVGIQEFKSEVLSALLGTVAGYVLSSNKPDDKPGNKPGDNKT